MASSFLKNLSRLFNRKIIVKKSISGKLKNFDFSKTQSVAGSQTAGGRYKWKNSKNTISGYGYGLGENTNINRQNLYRDYELMDRDGYLSSALDIYADESCSKNDYGEVLTIKTNDQKIKGILNNLFYDILNIEFNIWSWLRSMCKYGDYFLYLRLNERYGVTDCVPVHPLYIERFEDPIDSIDVETETPVRFIYSGDQISGIPEEISDLEVVHFRLLSDPNYLPYGKSIFEGARTVYKQLTLMEDAMMLHRIMRAPERRIFYVDVGSIPPEEVEGYINELESTNQRTPYIDQTTGEYNLKFNLTNMLEDIYVPTRGEQSSTKIESLPGLGNEGSLDDIEYLRDKMLSTIKISKNYLGLGEQGEAKANLASEDVRFSKTIERVQKIFVSELYKIAVIHLLAQGYPKEEIANFELELTNPSILLRRQKIDLLNEAISAISSARDLRMISKKYLYENILDMTEDQWKMEKKLVIEDLKEDFRLEQILSEGNDPTITGRSYGTKHDLAMAAMSAVDKNDKNLFPVYKEDERVNNPGRPEEPGSFETHDDEAFGRDPIGKKDIDKSVHSDSIESSLSNMIIESLVKSSSIERYIEKISKNSNVDETLDDI